MKFITQKGAPDIPLEVLEARDDDRLVIFCGSGISYQAGLKDFRGLVDQVYTSLPDAKTDLEQESYNQKQYDRVLELLERRYFSKKRADNYLVRKKIIENLTIKPGADLSTHKAILDLAKTKNGKVRLVTTNVDQGFQLADLAIETWTDTAPKLPVPKPYKWNSLVHLHGVINDSLDPNGEHFVFTSGDFGTAYLTERWASRFVGELFRNFIVLFIGYSINDPTIRYMTDAIAAERRKGDLHFRKPFILASTQSKVRSKDLEAWQTKGVEPILYNAGTAHFYLHETLKKWAAYCFDGMRAKERIIRINARIPPLPPFEDDQTKQVIDTLQERADKNASPLSGIPAKIFAEMDPVPSIEWLPALEKYGLLNIFSLPTRLQPVSLDPITGNLVQPNKPSHWLWQWLVHHLESETLIHWVMSNGGCLHPVLSGLIQDKLTGVNPPKEPYFTFWQFTVDRKVPCIRHDSFVTWRLLSSFKDSVSRMNLEIFLHSLSPKVKFSKPSRLYAELENSSVQKPYSAEILVQAGEEHLFEEIIKLENYPNLFIPILLDISMHLKKAMEMFETLGLAEPKHDRSHWDLPSIAHHDQNKRYNRWVILIELCRDVWQAAWKNDKNLANLILETWKNIRYPIFKRLVLHAYSIEGVVDPKIALDYLLHHEEGWWLWAIETEREKYRLLNAIWPLLPQQNAEKLIDKIVIGPPREMYREDLTEEEWKNAHARSVWKTLSKLETFGRELNKKGRDVLRQISEANIEWQLRGGDRDELSHWMEAGTWGEKSDITVAELVISEFEEIRALLSETTSEYYNGRLAVFRSFCKEEHERTYGFIEWLFSRGDWTNAIWHAALGSLSDDKKRQFSKIAHLIAIAPQHFYETEAWAIASWIKNVIETIEPESADEENFQKIFQKVLDYAPQSEFNNDGDVVTAAINDPIGMMSESLIARFGSRKFNRGDGIPGGLLANCLQSLIQGAGKSLILGRVILASRLHYFHAIDSYWTKRNIIDKMSWQQSDEALYLWEGYLWMPRIAADLLIDFKDDYLLAIKNASLLRSGKEHLFQLTTIILLQFPDSFTRNEKTGILKDIGSEGRVVVSDFLFKSYKDNEVKDDNVAFWKNRLEPLLKQFWPKDSDSISSATSRNLALLSIQSGEAFPDAVDTVTPIIGPVTDVYTIIRDLKKSDLPVQFPIYVVRLLGLIFTESCQYPTKDFRELLNILNNTDSSVSRNLVFQRIDIFLQERNL